MTSKIDQRTIYRRAFEAVLEDYRELAFSQGISVDAFYKAIARQRCCAAGNPLRIPVTVEDFLADVHLCAKSALDPVEYALFQEIFINNYDRSDTFRHYGLKSLKERVGRVFIREKLFPVSNYFVERSGTGTKPCSCRLSSHSALATSVVWCFGGCGLNVFEHSIAMTDFDPLRMVQVYWCPVCTKKDEDRIINMKVALRTVRVG